MHTDEYYAYITSRLRDAAPGTIRGVLNDLREEMLAALG
jgi:hypothetical protein